MDMVTDGAVLVLSGDFDVRSTAQVRHALYDHLALHADGDGEVVLDMSGVTSVDLTALRVLAVASRQAWLDGQHLVLRGCSPTVRRLLHVSRLARVLELERHAATA